MKEIVTLETAVARLRGKLISIKEGEVDLRIQRGLAEE